MKKVGVQANLRDANLWNANLWNANLRYANLQGANLRYANLQGADLRSANLRSANLQDADLRYANLLDATLPHFQIVPEEGSFIAWKKVRGVQSVQILKLLIPEEARRTSSLVGRKCRADFVKVLSGSGISSHDAAVYYEEGKVVHADSYDDDIRVECTHGIHFFITRKEAEEY